MRRRSAILALVIALAGFAAPSREAAGQAAQFKGLAAVSRDLSRRIAPPGQPIDLAQFLPAGDMDELLGTWSTFGTEHTFRNGQPNPLNLMIWQVTMAGFARAVGESCHTPRLAFHPSFIETLRELCAWPSASARSERVLAAFWTGMMGYGASTRDYAAWRAFFLGDFASETPAETVAAMTLAITLSPHFLLDR